MKRRYFISLLGLGALGAVGYKYWPDEGFWNPCRSLPMPDELLQHELVQQAWAGIKPKQVWDVHTHLIGTGDSNSGIWINPHMESLKHPIQYAQRKFYMNASCSEAEEQVDKQFLQRLLALRKSFPAGTRSMLLAFDFYYDNKGKRKKALSAYHTPDEYAYKIAKQYPDDFEWIASIHPYRKDAIQALKHAVKRGARAVKWLPPAMGIDPASPLCDPFYETMARLKIPLLTHGGDELAVHGSDAQSLGNPLRLRKPLEHGIKVIVAHSASLGSNVDLDKGKNGPQVSNFDLFMRMLRESRYEGQLFGEISALTQFNRVGDALDRLIMARDLHHQLINGSDYPLPGVMPLFSLTLLVKRGYISKQKAGVLSSIRQYNPLLFDFVLKRHLEVKGSRFAATVFHSRRIF
ncbi:MAG: hypothetical protein BMS9Abin11_0731 [Gammaproteobacteria bacterium]|nr:MAG: hypothetical protein BMS9Abin11_0731 [Gammaproteobacteria bacterium]